MRKLLKLLSGRRTLIIILLLAQAALILETVTLSAARYRVISAVLTVISIGAVLYIINRRDKPGYKVTWIVIILTFPLFGGLLYLTFRIQSSVNRLRRRYARYDIQAKAALMADNAASIKDAEIATETRYLSRIGYPVYSGGEVSYLPTGEEFFAALTAELKSAEKFIFLEYFIIDSGKIWSSILDILREKAKSGVDVRIIYDDMACMLTLPEKYTKTLASYGIKCQRFNPFRPFWTTLQNNRDHRKIAVIDGRAAFTGGCNLADEYANLKTVFGHWKDSAVMIRGTAVRSFTVMFLSMWDSIKRDEEEFASFFLPVETPHDTDNLDEFLSPSENYSVAQKSSPRGYIQPYADSPVDDEYTGEDVFLQLFNNARDYLYITTPYLIIDDAIITSLTLSARSGVDVRIITPHIPDKRIVHLTTRSYYAQLIAAGVRIYEYTPGFIHQKTFVSDDKTAVAGTTNLDFRSLYLHFECGVRFYNMPAVLDIKKDYLNTLTQCEEITADMCADKSIFVRLLQDVMRLCAPLM